jgi:UDP-N-acetylmuramoylalanine--D-glutamate ligase
MQNPAGKRILVVGLARTGRAAAEFFQRRGAVVTVSDARPPWSFERETSELLAQKIGVEFGQHGVETFLRQDLIVVSPGVPWDLPALVAARERGIPVVAEVEAASWFLKGRLVGVTGSNGKTTTTSLIGRMLKASGYATLVGGNIGVPMISMVEQASAESISVAELSSFQLEGTEHLHPQVAVVLNITPNHLDRHPSFEAYLEAKARILRNQTEEDHVVLNADDPAAAGLAQRTRAQKVFFSRSRQLPDGLSVTGGQVVYRVQHLERDLFSQSDVKLRGGFNLENVLAASATACVLGADFDAIARAVREFRGVEHRLEHVGEVSGVEFYNDSKATSVDATLKALSAFERGVHLILGGKDKGAPYAPLIPLLKSRVREVLVIGAASERIAQELDGTVDLVQAGDLETATRTAFSRARPSEVVLLSPACSSYDQFQDFEERGRKFKELVEELAREANANRARRPPFELKPPVAEPKIRPRVDSSSVVVTAARAVNLESTTVEQPPATSSKTADVAEDPRTGEAMQGSIDSKQPEASVDVEALFDAALDPPGREKPEPITSLPERIYVYEVDAEVRSPLDVEAAVSIDDVVLEPLPQFAAAGSVRGTIENEPLIFEVTDARAGFSGGRETAQQASSSARRGAQRYGNPAESEADS